jgi:phage-related minor tail protein
MDELTKQIESWKSAQLEYVTLRERYRSAFAAAYKASDGKNADSKKADADVSTSEARLERDVAETHAAAEWQLLLAMRGKIESSQRPGKHFGDAA